MKPARFLVAFAGLAYLVTVLATAFMNYRTLLLNDDDPDFAWMLVWQGIIYAFWIPVAVWVWRLFRHRGLVASAVWRYCLIGALTIPAHAIVLTGLDAHQATPGRIDLRSLAAQRAQLDILMYASFGVLALAAFFQRRSAEEAGAAEDIRLALDVARIALDRPSTQRQEQPPLMVSAGSRRIPVSIDDVEWFGSAGNYVVVNWRGNEGLVREPLQSLEKRLDPRLFARGHRGAIINLGKVAAAVSLSDGSWRLTMSSGAEVVVSRTYRDTILGRLGRKPAAPTA